MADKKINNKFQFIESYNKLEFFYNHLKEYKVMEHNYYTGHEKDLAPSQDNLNTKITPDLMWIQKASVAITQARRFQSLIENQECLPIKKQNKKYQEKVDKEQSDVNELQDQLK